MTIPTIVRPPRELCDTLAQIGSASVAGELAHMGIRDPQMTGPIAHTRGRSVAGAALTLQFMPKREDLHGSGEYEDPEEQLHRHVLYQAEAGDVVVVDARGDMGSGVFGEMMLAYLAGRGGAGVVIDGCIRDSRKAFELDMGFWIRGTTPNFHVQTGIVPFAVNVPIACGGTFVMPGDIIVADDDGAIVVPAAMAERVAKGAGQHNDWEEFSRLRLAEGGDLRRYYPLAKDAEPEYVAWRDKRRTGET